MTKNNEPIYGAWYWVMVEEDCDWIPARYMGDGWLVNGTPALNVHDWTVILPISKTAKFDTITILPKGILVVTPTDNRSITDEEAERIRGGMKKLLGNTEVVVFRTNMALTAVNPPDSNK